MRYAIGHSTTRKRVAVSTLTSGPPPCLVGRVISFTIKGFLKARVYNKGDNMNTIQILALLAMVSMSVPAALAFLMWRERNYYRIEVLNAEERLYYIDMEREYWRDLALAVADTDDYLSNWLGADDDSQWNYGPQTKWGSSNA